MKKVIIDSSSAILLYRCNIISSLMKYCSPVIPKAVFNELTIRGYDGADLFNDLCSAGKIKVQDAESGKVDHLTCHLHQGEREVIELFYEDKGDFIIIDDGKGGAFCRDNKIPYINALLAVKILFLKCLITEKEFFDAWSWLIANGRYSEKVKDRAGNADESRLAAFM
jgi:predicted nucleic acid-binding protein